MNTRTRKYLAAIRQLVEDNGIPPTIRELASAMGVSANAAYEAISRLEEHGLITRTRGKSRSIVVVQPAKEQA